MSINAAEEFASGGYLVTFWQGRGDCPSGCMWDHWWYFEVTDSGEVNKIAERGSQ